MTPAEFFVKVYDLRTLQNQVAEDYKNKAVGCDVDMRKADMKKLADEVDAELHKCDSKTQKTYYLLAKEKIQQRTIHPFVNQKMNELADKLGLEKI